ncbi:MAG: hypothetical protein GF333_03650 [Candidatus Omnitrophica bacterium]|nr:hypothetical protein [Candidatus Omnitrophota bacterium]
MVLCRTALYIFLSLQFLPNALPEIIEIPETGITLQLENEWIPESDRTGGGAARFRHREREETLEISVKDLPGIMDVRELKWESWFYPLPKLPEIEKKGEIRSSRHTWRYAVYSVAPIPLGGFMRTQRTLFFTALTCPQPGQVVGITFSVPSTEFAHREKHYRAFLESLELP